MSRVFTATETSLGRKVVVKVLPSEFAQGVSVEGFKREIQVAAELQHPHIVPVLAAGVQLYGATSRTSRAYVKPTARHQRRCVGRSRVGPARDQQNAIGSTTSRACSLASALAIVCATLQGCDRLPKWRGERLARNYCAACHMFPAPTLLDKKTWRSRVLPEMALRLGIRTAQSPFKDPFQKQDTFLGATLSDADWQSIVAYYLDHAPESLPRQSLPALPRLDPPFFRTEPFLPRMESSGIITLLETDSALARIFVGDAARKSLEVFDWNRRRVASLPLGSPPTGVISDSTRLLVLESGILAPNDEPRGRLAQYDIGPSDSFRVDGVLIDSLYRPVFVERYDFDHDGVDEFVICEFGNNRGRLALYKSDGAKYTRQVLDGSPGAVRVELGDMTGDGAPDIVALFAQGNERIELFVNDGRGRFPDPPRILARFPPVYGSMYFTLRDFNGDGSLDILYVNGDNFDYSRIAKPYHGVRILENDGKNNFHERYFFPIYGAARAAVADFDSDGDLDILATSNFADAAHEPDQGIVFLENTGRVTFQPYEFTAGAGNQWNLIATADLDKDGRPDVIIGAMNLESVATIQQGFGDRTSGKGPPLLVLQNRLHVH